MNKCGRCNSPLNSNNYFCPQCGVVIKPNEDKMVKTAIVRKKPMKGREK